MPVISESDLKKFIMFPYEVYKGDENWVAPLIFDEKRKLNRKKHPFYKRAEAEFFIARQNGKPVGRIAAIVDHHYEHPQGGKTAYWGYFESINDQRVANELFNSANEWAREKGCKRIIGPLSPSANDVAGLLIEGFNEPPVFMMAYNPEYYVNLVNNFGHTKFTDLYAWLKKDVEVPERTARIISRLKERSNFTIRKVNMKDWNNELETARKIFNEFEKVNPIYTPITKEEFAYTANDMKMIIDPDLVLVAEADGKPVGVSLTFPNINEIIRAGRGKLLPTAMRLLAYKIKKKISSKNPIDRIRVTSMGILDEYQKRGIDQVFYHETGVAALKNGYGSAEFSWVDEANASMNNVAKKLDAGNSVGVELYKKYRIYQYDLII